MHRTFLCACTTALACTMSRAAGDHEPVSLVADSGRWRTEGAAYRAVVEANGCLSSLRIRDAEFIDSTTGVSKGLYLWRSNRVEGFGKVVQPSPAVLEAAGEACQARYIFAADTIIIALSNRTAQALTLTAVLNNRIEAVSVDAQTAVMPPVTCTAVRSRWLHGAGALELEGATRLFGPWGKGNQALTSTLPAQGTATLTLRAGAATADEQAAAAHLAKPAAAAAPATDSPAAAAPERIRVDDRTIRMPPSWKETDDARAEGLKSLYFDGPDYHGKPTRVFAYYGAPPARTGEKVPAMVLVHGGAGTAYADWVRLWISRGYAAIAMDTCGSAPTGEPGQKSRSRRIPEGAGPTGWETSFGQIHDPLPDQWPSYAVNTIARARTLIGSFPEVDNTRVGLTGISWGGYLVCLAAACDSRYLFVAPVYGCGFLRERSAWSQKLQSADGAQWSAHFDPGHYLPDVRIPLLWVAGTNDRFYPIESLARSRERVRAPVSMCIRPGMTHSQEAGAQPEEIHAFADSFCRGGEPLPMVATPGVDRDGVAHVAFQSSTAITEISLLCTTNTDRAYPEWPWQSLGVRPGATPGWAAAKLPAGTRWWYFNLKDSRGLIVSTTPQEIRP